MPSIPGQRWSCHSCGKCCRALVGHLTSAEREQLDRRNWRERLGVAPYVSMGRSWVLNKTPDGACVFLDENQRCRIHAAYGEAEKPLACRIFPFSVRAVRGGWQASLRFDCPSVGASKGVPVEDHAPAVGQLARQLDHTQPADEDVAGLPRGGRAAPEEVGAFVEHAMDWIMAEAYPLGRRVVGLARAASTLARANFAKVRDDRFAELIDLLFGALPSEAASVPAAPTAKQRKMLRQLVFAHAEHASHAEMRAGAWGQLKHRWSQVGAAKRFRAGRGPVPPLPGIADGTTFEAVEAVRPAAQGAAERKALVQRYLIARLEGRTVFGEGYYGWGLFLGVGALCLALAAAGWTARLVAASAGRATLTMDDLVAGVGVIDAAATRAPSLGTAAERLRLSYLLDDDGLARLIAAYLPWEHDR